MTAGILFHCHHEELAEWTDNVEERCEWILFEKPKKERKLRLALLRLVPLEDLPADVRRVYVAWATPDPTGIYAPSIEVCGDWMRTCARWAKENHAKYCHPNCPWDGETIFAKGTSPDVLWGANQDTSPGG